MIDQKCNNMININDFVKMKLTRYGISCIEMYIKRYNLNIDHTTPHSKFRASMPSIDNDGYIIGQLWSLLRYFTNNMYNSESPFLSIEKYEQN